MAGAPGGSIAVSTRDFDQAEALATDEPTELWRGFGAAFTLAVSAATQIKQFKPTV